MYYDYGGKPCLGVSRGPTECFADQGKSERYVRFPAFSGLGVVMQGVVVVGDLVSGLGLGTEDSWDSTPRFRPDP